MAGHWMGVRKLHHRFCLGPGYNQQLFLLPPSRSDTVEQAILDHEVGDRVWRGLDILPFGHPHLSPAVFQPIVPELFLGESPASSNLLEQIKE